LDAKYKLFGMLAGVFTTCLVVGDIIGGKLIKKASFGQTITQTVGKIPFRVTFFLTDLLNEFHGKRAARFVTWVGFAMALLAYAFIYIALSIPIAEMTKSATWDGVTAAGFDNVFNGSKRMILASLIAY